MCDWRRRDPPPAEEALRRSLDDCKAGAVVTRAEDDRPCLRKACGDRAFLAITLRGRIHASSPTFVCVDHWTPLKCLLTDLDYSVIYTEDAFDLLWDELGCPV
jgi:hypothetical protein